jgi:hypothetical protein
MVFAILNVCLECLGTGILMVKTINLEDAHNPGRRFKSSSRNQSVSGIR